MTEDEFRTYLHHAMRASMCGRGDGPGTRLKHRPLGSLRSCFLTDSARRDNICSRSGTRRSVNGGNSLVRSP